MPHAKVGEKNLLVIRNSNWTISSVLPLLQTDLDFRSESCSIQEQVITHSN